MIVTMLAHAGQYEKGQTVEIADRRAQHLIAMGYAVAASTRESAKPPSRAPRRKESR